MKERVRRAALAGLAFVAAFISAAVFLGIGVALLLFALWHVLFTTAVRWPVIGEKVLRMTFPEEGKAKLHSVASSWWFKPYWIVTNMAYLVIAIYATMFLNFRLVEFLR